LILKSKKFFKKFVLFEKVCPPVKRKLFFKDQTPPPPPFPTLRADLFPAVYL